jgi:hypothetical protein
MGGLKRARSTSRVSELMSQIETDHLESGTGIAHTRWATHGGKTDQNAHPHTDSKGRVAIVHNGTINNSHELRKELQAQGIKFLSETDTEVIAQLIGHLLAGAEEAGRPLTVRDATAKALARCDGTSAGPGGLEALEALAFGEQRWWAVEDVIDHGPRTIPYRMLEFLADLAAGSVPDEPIDITPSDEHVERWRSG